MAAPIILWNPANSAKRDENGIGFIDTVLPTPSAYTPRYRNYDPTQPRSFEKLTPSPSRKHTGIPISIPIPKLASFCIRVLCEYPEQLHQLGSLRLHYYDEEEGGTDDVLRSLLAKWKTPHFSLLNVDPRLWATIIQIYRNPPDVLTSYPCQLSDPYVPLLNQIPSSPDFALITVLDLQRSSNVTDTNILSLKVLHNLTALDLSGCSSLSTRSIEGLSRTLVFNECGERRGPWALRILRMRSCIWVDRNIFKSLHAFPLLSVLDLRDTLCTARDIERPFFSTTEDTIFDLPITEAVEHLSEAHRFMYSTERPFILSLEERPLTAGWSTLRTRAATNTVHSGHNSFVVLPSLKDGKSSLREGASQIRFGNTDTMDFARRQLEGEIRRGERDYTDYDLDCDSDPGSGGYEYGGLSDDAFTREDSDEDEVEEEEEEDGDEDDFGNEDEDNYGNERSNPTLDSSVNTDDSDDQLRIALQESIMSRLALHTPASTEAVTATSLPTATRRDMNMTAASTDRFYRLRETLPPPRRIKLPISELALLRVPPVWQTLDAVKPRATHSDGARRAALNSGNAALSVKRKPDASMQLLQGELSKRRRVIKAADTSDVAPGNSRDLSAPPSPTLTVCDAREMAAIRTTSLRPISNLQPPPKSSFLSRPRLKLESTAKTVDVSSSKRAAQASTVPSRQIKNKRNNQNMSLVEGFKKQSQKSRSKPSTGTGLKSSTTDGRNDIHGTRESSLRNEKQKNGQGKGIVTGVKLKADGFNWEGWSKR